MVLRNGRYETQFRMDQRASRVSRWTEHEMKLENAAKQEMRRVLLLVVVAIERQVRQALFSVRQGKVR